MSTGFDDNFDWTNGTSAAPAAVKAEDFEIADLSAANDVDQIDKDAADRDFQPPPPGDHLFEVIGFWKAPEAVEKSGYVRGQVVRYTSYKVGVKLAVVGRRNLSTLEFFELPPLDPAGISYFQQASKNPDGSDPGFMNRKFEQFVNKIGFAFPRNGKLPPEARKLGNWVGRQVWATVVAGKEDRNKIDPSTGSPYPPKPQIKLFSFRAAESTMAGGPTVQAPRPASTPPAPHAAQSGRPMQTAGSAASAFANKGLENI